MGLWKSPLEGMVAVMIYDYCIVGAGIVGLSVAHNLLKRYPKCSVLVLEKESSIGMHQTSHNSGVIHAGIYYAPESLKASLCREGLMETKIFCEENSIPYKTCGKLIVATNAVEEERVKVLYERANNNGANIKLISSKELIEIEPNITGTLALLSPNTGIVDYHQIAQKMAEIISINGDISLSEEVFEIKEEFNFVNIATNNNSYRAAKLIACAGLQADRIAQKSGLDINCKIVPFRGEYFRLPDSKSNLIKHLIYPAPDPALPFLGVHLTKMINGSITVGPNAVLGWSREGYEKFSINTKDATSFLIHPGFWKLIWRNRVHAWNEIKGSLIKQLYLKSCQKYCPSLELTDLLPSQAGIRAQVVNSSGDAYHDFLIKKTHRMLHVLNAPSPAATSSLPIGRMIVDQISS